MDQMLEKVLNDRLDELEPYQQYILFGLIFLPMTPFVIVPLMFITLMVVLNGLNEMLDEDTVPAGGHIEPTRPWPRC